MIIIPIGFQCGTATFKNEIKKSHSLPFDWMLSTPQFVFEMLVLLLEQNMDIDELVKNHFFYCDKKASIKDLGEHYYTYESGETLYGAKLYNTKYNAIFVHDNNDIESINKYIRRFKRLKDIILNSPEDLYFVHVSPSSPTVGYFTIDGNDAIKDAYGYITKIYKLIGKFRNNYKMILFDAVKKEPIELLDENITLYKLNGGNHWSVLVSQMSEYKHFFTK